MYKIILHIGMPKSGSTSIQSYLFKNRFRLAREGFGFLTCLGKGNQKALAYYARDPNQSAARQLTTNLGRLGLSRQQGHAEIQSIIQNQIDAEIETLPDSVHTLVFSSEVLTRLKKDHIEALYALMSRYAVEITILVYLRDQASYIESSYTTSVRGGKRHSLIGHANRELESHYLDFTKLIKRWEDYFGVGNVMPRVFSKTDLKEGDAVVDFCDVTGIPFHRSHENVEISNKSLDKVIITQINAMNRQVYEINRKDNARRSFEVMQSILSSEDFSGHRIALPSEMLAEIEAKFAASNEAVRRRFFPEKDRLFVSRQANAETAHGDDVGELGRTDFLEALIHSLLKRRITLEDLAKQGKAGDV